MKIIKTLIVELSENNKLKFEIPRTSKVLDIYLYPTALTKNLGYIDINKNKMDTRFNPFYTYSFELTYSVEKDFLETSEKDLIEYIVLYKDDMIPENASYYKSFHEPFSFHLFQIYSDIGF